jgi:oligosaccharyltransferase complex subunit beta
MRFSLAVLAQFALSIAASVKGVDLLLVYDAKLSPLESYTELVSSLESQGLKVETADSSSDISIADRGVFHYQHVVILPSKQRKLGKDITGAQLVDFFNQGGDVLALTSPLGVSEAVRTFWNELGVYPAPKGYELIDHFTYDKELGQEYHNIIQLNEKNFLDQSIVRPLELSYQGSSALLNNNPQLIPLIQAPTTSFAKSSKDGDEEWTVGKQGYLSVAFQGLNDARALWAGDANLLSNQFLDQDKQFVNDLIQWVFGIKNVLKTKAIRHSHADGTPYEVRPYKIKDDIHYEIELQQWDGSKWVPYVASDLQLEIKLLDPYHRLNLSLVSSSGESALYSTDFKLPDKHGVFSFQIDYKRPGFTFLEEKDILSIRHLANDEYPRSWEITNSWVYITSSIVVFSGWFVFVLAFIYGRDETTADRKKEK